ncbi:phosphoglycerate kinase [Desulfatibacillum aliphaticivorans]|uniref:Phosphoglycerate kinase n=1 Tax=Desulfatibacillum aliphaticivorans TaxID=218208 RepID=B8FMT6_DESAL|nr:phosphoglycerate kinase [Desulfatibacillum aliphaticivorans]ACL01953.1 Putative phosphoglycerate kinase [Desulfatibacillum aliphaticivorans]
MNRHLIDSRLPLIQDADLAGKVVLVRVDHNVVKKGVIHDPYRIDATLGTLYNIVERGGRPILMTHVGRPKDKKTGTIKVDAGTSVQPIVEYLERKLYTTFAIPEFPVDGDQGIRQIDTSINWHIRDLNEHRIGGIYLPNTRWFSGEAAKGDARERLARQLAGLADVFVNDAFGSWQPDASTFDVAEHLPSYAGFLMQKELINLRHVLDPEKPFVAVVAGAKYDTKIGPLQEIYKKVDHLILGGVIYNAFLCAKYGITVGGVSETDVKAARELVAQDKEAGKIVELPFLVESDTIEGRVEGKYRTVSASDFAPGQERGYFLDIAPESFDTPQVAQAIAGAKTIFVNAVMGLTPHFYEGSQKLDATIDANTGAQKFYGGGDTLQEFKNLSPGLYLAAMDSAQYYFFTGGGTVLKAIEEGSPYGLDPVKALMENKERFKG